VTTIALLIGIVVAHFIKPGEGIVTATTSSSEVSTYTTRAESFSWWNFLKENITIQVLLFSIVFGVVISKINARDKVTQGLKFISKYVFKALHYVMILAPIGAFGGMAFTIGKYGIHTLVPLAKLMITVYVTMALFIFVVLFLILRTYKVSLWKFLKYIREELLIVLGTSSSEAGLPSLMEKLERMGCSKPVVGLVVPAGYSFNLDGTTLYLSMAVIFLAQAFAIDLSLYQMATIIGVLFITSKGAAGVTGSGFVVLASTLTAIKIIPVEGLALLLGVDRFMSEARAITNFIGNGVATIWLANNEKEFDRSKMNHAFSNLYETEDILKDNVT
jgi:aerobic C4-dicarboxylate transport protein